MNELDHKVATEVQLNIKNLPPDDFCAKMKAIISDDTIEKGEKIQKAKALLEMANYDQCEALLGTSILSPLHGSSCLALDTRVLERLEEGGMTVGEVRGLIKKMTDEDRAAAAEKVRRFDEEVAAVLGNRVFWGLLLHFN